MQNADLKTKTTSHFSGEKKWFCLPSIYYLCQKMVYYPSIYVKNGLVFPSTHYPCQNLPCSMLQSPCPDERFLVTLEDKVETLRSLKRGLELHIHTKIYNANTTVNHATDVRSSLPGIRAALVCWPCMKSMRENHGKLNISLLWSGNYHYNNPWNGWKLKNG